jgi:hypothetical protein
VAGEEQVNAALLQDRGDLAEVGGIHPPVLVAESDDPGRPLAVNRRKVRPHEVEHLLDAAVNVGLAVEGEEVHALRRAGANLEAVEHRTARVGVGGDAAVADLVLRAVGSSQEVEGARK